MRRTLASLVTAAAVTVSACAGSRPWPAHPVARVASAFDGGRSVATIDVLPVDLQLWAQRGYAIDLDEVRGGAEQTIANHVVMALAERGYSLGAMIEWDGSAPAGQALAANAVLSTVTSLGRYGEAVRRSGGRLPPPLLPARLGETTGSEATLYVGGWGYLTPHRESTGEQIAKAVAIGLVVIAVVALIVIAAKGDEKRDKRDKHDKRKRDQAASERDHRTHGGVEPSRAPAERSPIFTASRGREHVGRHHRLDLVDVFGRAAIDLALSSPDWAVDPQLPRQADDPDLYLEMTLVDNRTGEPLWHAQQRFPGDATSDDDLARATRSLLDQLPVRQPGPPTLPAAPAPPAPPAPPSDAPTVEPAAHPAVATSPAPQAP